MKIDAVETYSWSQLISHAPLQKQQLQDQINELLFQITQPEWNRIVRFLLKKHQESFFEYPAVKSNHNNYAGGLAYLY